MAPSIKARTGDNVTISCYATGPQPIKYSWTLNGSLLNTAVAHQVDNVLIVRPQTAKHFGTYICKVSRGSSWDAYGVKLEQIDNCYQTRPSGKLKLEDDKMTASVKADVGDKVVLVCFATSPFPIKYRWTKNGEPIPNADSINVSDNVVVVKTKTENDFGIFVCTVDDGKDVTSYAITVKGFSSPKPRTAAKNNGKRQVDHGSDIIVPVVLILIIQLVTLALILMYFIKQRFRRFCNPEYKPKVRLSRIMANNETDHTQDFSSEHQNDEVSRFSKKGRQKQYLRFNDDEHQVDFRGSGNLTLDDINSQY